MLTRMLEALEVITPFNILEMQQFICLTPSPWCFTSWKTNETEIYSHEALDKRSRKTEIVA